MNRVNIMRAVRAILAVAMLIFVSTLFGGGKSISNAAFADVKAAVISGVDMSEMQMAENRMIKRLYGISSGDYENVVLYYPTTNMGAEEILLVQLSDPSQSDALVAAIESRLATQKKSFDGYGAEQTDLLTNFSRIDVQGNYVLFVVNKNAATIAANFENSL